MKKSILAVLLILPITAALAKPNRTQNSLDPDDAYKNNCMRCHSSVQAYSPEQTETIMLHMRVRANLTARESKAILDYLLDNASTKSTRKQAAKQKSPTSRTEQQHRSASDPETAQGDTGKSN